MTLPLDPSLLQAFTRMDTCSVANSIEDFHVRLRNEGFCDGSIRCMIPSLPPIAGYAVTGKIRCSAPPTFGPSFLDRTDWWDLVLHSPTPRIVVLQDVDSRPGLGAFVGEVHGNVFRALNCSGYVTNGAVRSLPAAKSIGLQMFAGNVAVSHAFAHVISFGEPVEIGGLKIHTGDLLHADQHGVLQIPLEIAAEIPAAVGKNSKRRRKIIELCQSPNFSLEALSKVVGEPD